MNIKIEHMHGDIIEAGGVKNVTNHYHGSAAPAEADDMQLPAAPVEPVKEEALWQDEKATPTPPDAVEMETQVMEATRGWNVPDVFAGSWSRWQALWRHLLAADHFRRSMAERRPKGALNHTQINMQMVCNVCRLYKADVKCLLTDKQLAAFIDYAWEGDSARGFIGLRDTVLTRADSGRIRAWLAEN